MNPEELAKQLGGSVVQPEASSTDAGFETSTPMGVENFAKSLGGQVGEKDTVFSYLTGNEGEVTDPQQLSFLDRFKLSFGGPESIAKLKEGEAQMGLRGKLDIGDVADVAGSIVPIIGGILGGLGGTLAGTPVSAPAGVAIGTTAGESLKQAIGRAMGVREDESLKNEFVNLGATFLGTYAGGKITDKAFNLAFKRIPERFYSGIFKNTADDIASLAKTEELLALQKTNPALFNEYVKNGVVSLSNGIPQVNKTLAREVLESGLRGNPRTMLGIAYGRMLELENEVRKQVAGKVLKISNKGGYEKILKTFIQHFDENSFGFNPERLANAQKLLSELQKSGGNTIPAETALWLRRFIDGMRNTRSFVADSQLAPKQEAFKSAANALRGELSKQLGLGGTMGKYRVYIEAFDTLADYAAKKENAALVNLTDAIVGGGGLASGFPGTGLGLMFALRLFQQPMTRTSLGQGIYQTGKFLEKFPQGITPSLVGQKIGEMVPQFIPNQPPQQ